MNSGALAKAALTALVLYPPLGAEAQSHVVPQPTEPCRDHSPTAIVTFADADVEEVDGSGCPGRRLVDPN